MRDFPQTWTTDEATPRKLIAKGRSLFSQDCLVAYFEGEEKPIWLLDNGSKTEGVYVVGVSEWPDKIYARLTAWPEQTYDSKSWTG